MYKVREKKWHFLAFHIKQSSDKNKETVLGTKIHDCSRLQSKRPSKGTDFLLHFATVTQFQTETMKNEPPHNSITLWA